MRTGENVAITKIYFAASAFRVGRVNVAPYIYLAAHVDVSRICVHLHLVAHNAHVYDRTTRCVCARVCVCVCVCMCTRMHLRARDALVRAYVCTYSCVHTSARAYADTIFSSRDSSNISDVDVSRLPISLYFSYCQEIVSNRNEFSVNDREDSLGMKSSVSVRA